MERSLAFYRDLMGFQQQSPDGSFVRLKGANIDVYLWDRRWDWDAPARGERAGLGMYPHIERDDVPATVERFRKAGYKIVMEPRAFSHGHEAFVADPDGYVWSLISPQPDSAGARE